MGIFKRFLTLFDGLFTDPGRPGVAGTAGPQPAPPPIVTFKFQNNFTKK